MSLRCKNPYNPGDSLTLGVQLPTLNGSSEVTACCWFNLVNLPDPNIGHGDEAAFIEFAINNPPTNDESRFAIEVRNPVPAGTLIAFYLVLRAPDAGGFDLLSSPPGLATGITHVAVSVNLVSKEVRLYIQGLYVGSAITVATGNAFSNTNSAFAGIAASDDTTHEYIDGFLEDIRVYTRILSDAEIRTIFECQGVDGIVLGLRHRYELQSGFDGQLVVNLSAQDTGVVGRDAVRSTGTPAYAPSIAPTYRRRLP